MNITRIDKTVGKKKLPYRYHVLVSHEELVYMALRTELKYEKWQSWLREFYFNNPLEIYQKQYNTEISPQCIRNQSNNNVWGSCWAYTIESKHPRISKIEMYGNPYKTDGFLCIIVNIYYRNGDFKAYYFYCEQE